MNVDSQRSLLVVVSAPSGAGKTTLCRRLTAADERLQYSVSCTTRPPRKGERDGLDYRFLDESTFQRYADAGQFLEWASVHGHRYGTLRSSIEETMRSGRDVLMDIDVQGAALLRRQLRQTESGDVIRRGHLDIFLVPPSLAELRRRLENRASDSAAVIEERLRNAALELECWRDYRYLVVNENLQCALRTLRAIITAERHRVE